MILIHPRRRTLLFWMRITDQHDEDAVVDCVPSSDGPDTKMYDPYG